MNKPQLEIPVLNIPVHPDTMDGRDPTLLWGDAISGDRYYSAEFASAEWEHMWTKIWHVAGRLTELEAQQNGWQSQGFEDYYLADQESRVRYFHEVLNDYLAGHKGV